MSGRWGPDDGGLSGDVVRVRAYAAVTVAVGLLLAGCQTPAAEPAPEPEDPAAVLTRLATEPHPRSCTLDYTGAGLEAAIGTDDVERCEARVQRSEPAASVEVSQVAVGSTDLEACRDAVRTSEPADEVVVDQVVVEGGTGTAR